MLSRTAFGVARRAAMSGVVRRSFVTSVARRSNESESKAPTPKVQTLADIKTIDDLVGPGAKAGTVPTDLEQSTGLERLEILGKMEGIDIFNMKPLDAPYKGTIEKPVMVRSAGEEQFVGCTGFPKDSHEVLWLGMDKKRPVERCPECGSVFKMEFVGKEDDHHHGHDHHAQEDVKTFADYVHPKYY
ncbi:hypothetical protein PspLS_03109 [Pyricularia sp. CBS 133598]|nr:hypothetical protein PspLS_03109 [Pyricularia sp. CBS 133598]